MAFRSLAAPGLGGVVTSRRDKALVLGLWGATLSGAWLLYRQELRRTPARDFAVTI